MIKLTGAVSGKPVYVNIDDAFLIEQVVEPVNDTNAEFLGKTMIFKNASSHPAMVEETPEEIAAMIQKAQDDHMLAEFAKHAIAIDARDSCIRADLAFDDAQAMLQEFKERTQK